MGVNMPDNPLDVLIHNGNEALTVVLCQEDHHLRVSSHNVVILSFTIIPMTTQSSDLHPRAPRVDIPMLSGTRRALSNIKILLQPPYYP